MTLVVFDIDGTLANIEHRRKYVRSKPKNWPAFEKAIPFDTVIEPVRTVYRALYNEGCTIILASGRNESQREKTNSWLLKNNFYGWTELLMRPAQDYRPDHEIKKEILGEIVRKYRRKPDFVVDDRPQVVRMWRDNGVFVFNVHQSDEEF